MASVSPTRDSAGEGSTKRELSAAVAGSPTVAQSEAIPMSPSPAAELDDGQDVLSTWPAARYEALIAALGVAPWHDTRYQLKVVSRVMSGEEFSTWLIRSSYAADTEQAVEVATGLMARMFLFPMRRSDAKLGFLPSPDYFYQQQEEREERSAIADVMDRAKQAAVRLTDGTSVANFFGPTAQMCAATEPVISIPSGLMVESVVLERQRRGAASYTEAPRFSEDMLMRADPPQFSCDRAAVPIPSVGNATPDECEWVDSWAVVVTNGETDEEGWVYAEDFAAVAAKRITPAFEESRHRVRVRAWHRYARHKPEEVEVVVAPREEEMTAAMLEERRRRELLNRAAEAAAKARQQFAYRWEVAELRWEAAAAIAPSSIFLVSEHLARRSRSSVVDRIDGTARTADGRAQPSYRWSDCRGTYTTGHGDVVGFAVWASMTLGRKQYLGYASFSVPSDTADITTTPLEVADAATGKSIGTLLVTWDVARADPLPEVLESAPAAAPATTGIAMFGERTVLYLDIRSLARIDRRMLEKFAPKPSRFACMIGASPKCQIFVRLKYRGLVAPLIAETPRVAMSRQPRFDYTVVLALRPMIPVVLEVVLVQSSKMHVVGRAQLTYRDSDPHDEPVMITFDEAFDALLAGRAAQPSLRPAVIVPAKEDGAAEEAEEESSDSSSSSDTDDGKDHVASLLEGLAEAERERKAAEEAERKAAKAAAKAAKKNKGAPASAQLPVAAPSVVETGIVGGCEMWMSWRYTTDTDAAAMEERAKAAAELEALTAQEEASKDKDKDGKNDKKKKKAASSKAAAPAAAAPAAAASPAAAPPAAPSANAASSPTQSSGFSPLAKARDFFSSKK